MKSLLQILTTRKTVIWPQEELRSMLTAELSLLIVFRKQYLCLSSHLHNYINDYATLGFSDTSPFQDVSTHCKCFCCRIRSMALINIKKGTPHFLLYFTFILRDQWKQYKHYINTRLKDHEQDVAGYMLCYVQFKL